jgi:hypothetical protein
LSTIIIEIVIIASFELETGIIKRNRVRLALKFGGFSSMGVKIDHGRRCVEILVAGFARFWGRLLERGDERGPF